MRFWLALALLLPLAAMAQDTPSPPRAIPGEACPVTELPEWWSDSERWAWTQICEGRSADMSRFDAGDEAGCDALSDETWPASRRLSARFIHQITTRAPFTQVPARPIVRVFCAQVDGRVDLDFETVPHTVWLDNSRVADGLNLSNTVFADDFSLDGSAVGRQVFADRMTVGGTWFLGSGRFAGVQLRGASVGGALAAVGSAFTAPPDGGPSFNADSLAVDGSLFLNGGASFEGVRLVGAAVGGVVSAIGSAFTATPDGGPSFDADGLAVDGSLFLRGGASFEGVRLRGATVGGDVEADGSAFTAPPDGRPSFDASSLTVEGNLFLRGGASFDGVDLPDAAIGGALQMQGSQFAGLAELSDADIGEVAVFSFGGQQVGWEAGSALNLRNASAGALQAVMPHVRSPGAVHSWRRDDGDGDGGHEPLPVDLTNFRYDRLGGFGAEETGDLSRVDAARLIAWLDQSRRLMPGDGYAPGPYMHLAAILRGMGAEAAAEEVDYARLLHRTEARAFLLSEALDGAYETPGGIVTRATISLGDVLARWVVGFGIYPERAGIWFAGLVALGWIAGGWSPELRARGPASRFWYSLENALPLIELSGDFAGIRHDGAPVVANLFHFQKVAGFALATVLVGALTVLGE